MADCSNCTNAEWGAKWSEALSACVAASQSEGCDGEFQCDCFRGFQLSIRVPKKGDPVAKLEWFTGGWDDKHVYHVDVPGPLAIHDIKRGSIIHRINGKPVTPKVIKSFSPNRPIRHLDATKDKQGRWLLRARR